MSELTMILGTLLGVGIGVVLGYIIRVQMAKAKIASAEVRAEQLITEAKNKEKETLLRAKDDAITIINEAKKEEKERRQELQNMRERLEKRENMFDQKILEFENTKTKLQQKIEDVQKAKEKINEITAQAEQRLQEISGLTKEQALETLIERIAKDTEQDVVGRIAKIERANTELYEAKAREIVIDAIQRSAADHASETTSTAITLPSDEMKGRIIGKDGRNIKAIEKLTGCELIIDDTPDMLLISGFSPIRRRVCYLALEKLIKDGRIQPARIEEYITEAKKELALDIKQAGEEALYKLGITGLDPKLVSIVGRLKYRTSYGQNILNHSVEVAHLCAMIAEEVGIDPIMAKKAGFFHDIGKAVDQDTQGTHMEIGETILKKFGLHEDICYAARHHHDDQANHLITDIVKAGDAISASRVGARRDTYEQYVMRLEELERVAKNFDGIDKVYAIQAGREVRVFVKPDQIDDFGAYNLAKDIARKIESELQYPGEIKVHVIRESRVIEYAK